MNSPTFALVGAVNHGKSSIAATLVERGNIAVSADPGMTQVCQRIEHHSSEVCSVGHTRVSGSTNNAGGSWCAVIRVQRTTRCASAVFLKSMRRRTSLKRNARCAKFFARSQQFCTSLIRQSRCEKFMKQRWNCSCFLDYHVLLS